MAPGPDAQGDVNFTITSTEGTVFLVHFFASELRLRGDKPVTQPHHLLHDNVFCWNGEVRKFIAGITLSLN